MQIPTVIQQWIKLSGRLYREEGTETLLLSESHKVQETQFLPSNSQLSPVEGQKQWEMNEEYILS